MIPEERKMYFDALHEMVRLATVQTVELSRIARSLEQLVKELVKDRRDDAN